MSSEAAHLPTRSDSLMSTQRPTVLEYLGDRKTWLGNYDYRALCIPRLPCLQAPSHAKSLFIGLHDPLPIIMALLMGLQHALPAAASSIIVPRILAGPGLNHLNLTPDEQSYLISSALVVSGLTTIMHTARFRLFHGYWLGTGLICMSGSSFAFVPVAEATFAALYEEGLCVPGSRCPQAYGKWLGTVAIGALVEIALSFLPHSLLRTMFPPIVTGSAVFLLGASLVSVGLRSWAGGAGPCLTASNIIAVGGEASVPESLQPFLHCPNVSGPGIRHYPWGAPQWIGLGFLVFSIIILVEIFGSPFMRNLQVIIGLFSGIVIAAILGYLDGDFIRSAPVISFPLVRRFPLGIYAPALIPVLLAYVITGVSMIGAVTSVAEASRIPSEGPDFESRVHGGLLTDGFTSLLSALLTSSPTTTFSENNAIIIMTDAANPYVGVTGGMWLVLFGMLGKIGGIIAATPEAVIGGMTTILFAGVAVAGMEILSSIHWGRRERFILAVTIGVGLGVAIQPNSFATFIPDGGSTGARAVRQGVVIILSTGFSIGAVIAGVMNAVLPLDVEEIITGGEEKNSGGEENCSSPDLAQVSVAGSANRSKS